MTPDIVVQLIFGGIVTAFLAVIAWVFIGQSSDVRDMKKTLLEIQLSLRSDFVRVAACDAAHLEERKIRHDLSARLQGFEVRMVKLEGRRDADATSP